jgi:hypothetical protein
MPGPRCLVRFTIFSVFDTLDLIQVVSDRLSAIGGLDEDATHWVGVSVRESVINAIKHGNRFDPSKLVTVEFSLEPARPRPRWSSASPTRGRASIRSKWPIPWRRRTCCDRAAAASSSCAASWTTSR